jgi:hypothetical protein
MTRRARALLAALAVWMAQPAAGDVVRVPLRLDPSFLGRLLEAQVFSAPGATLRLRGAGRCSEAVLSAPSIEIAPARLQLRSEAVAHGGVPIGRAACWRIFSWSGALEAVQGPYLDAGARAVRFRVIDSALKPRSWTLLPQERLWGWMRPALHPHLERLRVDLGPALDDLRSALPLFVRPGDVARAARLADSLALDSVRAEADAVVIEVRFEVDATPPPASPEAPLGPAELAALRDSLRRLDAFVTFVVKHAGRDAGAPALRSELLEVLLDARYELVLALAEPSSPGGGDRVRTLFLRTWTRLAPLLRQVDAEVSAESALRYLSFIAAGDALAALDAATPAFGFELSSDGLRRLARTLAPAASGDPLARSRAVDPELREIFGFGAPLPPPAPQAPVPEASPPAPSPEASPQGSAAPQSVTEPPPAPEPPASSQLLPRLGRALAALLAAPASAAPEPPRELAALAARLNRWAPSRSDFRDYLPLAGRLLRGVGADVQAESGLAPPYRDFYTALLLAAGWQESCWRQFVERGGKLVPLRSPTGDVGILQVNERVWRGFYERDGLRSDVAYNARAGGEILLHYLRDFALARGEERRGGREALASSTYAMYNGGPAARSRWRDANAPAALRALDAAFLLKYKAMRAEDETALEDCYTG